MALKIWMPFISNTDNQGLASTVTNQKTAGTYTAQTSGKLGGCYSGYGLYHTDTEFLGNQWSVAAWVSANSFGQYNNIIFCKNISASTDCHIYWSIISNNTYNIGVNGPSGTTSYAYTFSTNTWYHLATTYDGARIKMYINGNLVRDVAYTSTQATGCLNFGLGARSGNAAGTSAVAAGDWKFNDFRLYDTAISTKEVEELARGLVVHYKLSDSYIEGTTNLVTTQDGLSNTCYNGATGKYSYGTNTDMYKEVTTWEGRQGTKVHMGTDNLSAYPYVYFDAFDASGTAIKTLSFDYYPTLQDTLIPYSYNGYYNWSCYVNGRYFSATNVGQIVLTGVRVNQWNHIEVTAQKYDTTSAARGIGYIRLGSASHTSNTSNFWFFSNIQVEAKDHATAYAGVGGTRVTSLKVKDSSGYQHHGTINDLSIATSTDTARYTNSLKNNQAYNSGTYPLSGPLVLNDIDQITISLWARPTTMGHQNSGIFSTTASSLPTDYQTTVCNHYDDKLACCNTSGTVVNLSVTGQFTLNEWHLYTFVYDGTKAYFYKDGVLKTSVAQTGKLKPITQIFPFYSRAGGANRTTSGCLSDMRVYVTALSDKQVLELYNETAAIDRSGALYVREVIE